MRRKWERLSNPQKDQIVKARNSGRSVREVAVEFGVSISTVALLCAKAKRTNEKNVNGNEKDVNECVDETGQYGLKSIDLN